MKKFLSIFFIILASCSYKYEHSTNEDKLINEDLKECRLEAVKNNIDLPCASPLACSPKDLIYSFKNIFKIGIYQESCMYQKGYKRIKTKKLTDNNKTE
tara:strand:- start:339 stop:635 length:297 start_codon:yes stop_codon:yes gene_type:complete